MKTPLRGALVVGASLSLAITGCSSKSSAPAAASSTSGAATTTAGTSTAPTSGAAPASSSGVAATAPASSAPSVSGAAPSQGAASVKAGSSVSYPAENTSLKGQTITIWGGSAEPQVLKKNIAGFEALTGATVKVTVIPNPYEQTIQTKVQTGDKPDLASWQPTASELSALNAKQNLQDLGTPPWLSKYTPGLANITGILNGTRYAALVSTPAVEGVYYNKPLFAKAGITTLPKNWADLVADAKILKAKGITPFYEMGGDRWATQWWVQVQLADAAKKGLWDRVNNNKEKFTDPTILGAIKNYKALIDAGYFNKDIKTGTLVQQAAALTNGTAAMALQVNSFFTQVQQVTPDTAKLNKIFGFFPISPTGNVGTFIPDQTNAFVAFKTGDPKREAAARQFMAYVMGTGYADYVNSNATVSIETGTPTPASVPDALKQVAASTGSSVGSMQALAVANPDLYINLANMIQGTETPEKVASTTQDQFAQLAKALGDKAFS
jgi:raffinose/stachyose/melibiose transport system substrate-binding protein